MPNRVSIHDRPACIDNKLRIGDLKGDTVIGKNKKGALLTLVDRKTLYTFIARLDGKNATALADSLNLATYFADAYSSWQRGANENANGLIRQYLPKDTDFTKITDEKVQQVQDALNNRPRKSRGYK